MFFWQALGKARLGLLRSNKEKEQEEQEEDEDEEDEEECEAGLVENPSLHSTLKMKVTHTVVPSSQLDNDNSTLRPKSC